MERDSASQNRLQKRAPRLVRWRDSIYGGEHDIHFRETVRRQLAVPAHGRVGAKGDFLRAAVDVNKRSG